MRIVYRPDNLVDAHLMRHVLESEGLSCFIAGEHLLGGIGDLPVSGLLQLWVQDQDELRACELIEECRRGLEMPVTDAEFEDPSEVPQTFVAPGDLGA